MIEIKDLLLRFESVLLREGDRIGAIQKSIENVTGIKLDTKNINIKRHSIFLDIKPIYKAEILLKQEEIALKLEEILCNKIPTKIR